MSRPALSAADLIGEGLDDAREIAARRARWAAIAPDERSRLRHLRRAKDLAQRIGLAYWPALICETNIDPRAFVAAERVLQRMTGQIWAPARGETRKQWGGWDYMGHYGLSPYHIADMWRAAGCRDTEKFRFQVATGFAARKGDSLPWLRDFVRGHRWLAGNRIGLPLARKTIAVLGKLSPALRRAALQRFFAPEALPDAPIRVRDLDWPAVRRAQDIMRRGTPRARAALESLTRAAELLGCPNPDDAPVTPDVVADALLPNARAPLRQARQLVLGAAELRLEMLDAGADPADLDEDALIAFQRQILHVGLVA